jgi:hypothetical protein
MVLARVASSCTRLVDSILASVADFKKEEQHAPQPAEEVARPAGEPQPAVREDVVPEPNRNEEANAENPNQ